MEFYNIMILNLITLYLFRKGYPEYRGYFILLVVSLQNLIIIANFRIFIGLMGLKLTISQLSSVQLLGNHYT